MNQFPPINESLQAGWDGYKKNFMLLGGLALGYIAFAVLMSFLIGVVTLTLGSIAQTLLIDIVIIIVGIVLEAEYIHFGLQYIKGEAVSFKTWKPLFKESGYKTIFMQLLIGSIILFIGTFILSILIFGSLLNLIATILIVLYIPFYPFLIVDKKMNFMDACKKSMLMTKGVKGQLILFFILLAALNILGAIALVVGLVVTIPVSLLAMVYVYSHLIGEEDMPVEVMEAATI